MFIVNGKSHCCNDTFTDVRFSGVTNQLGAFGHIKTGPSTLTLWNENNKMYRRRYENQQLAEAQTALGKQEMRSVERDYLS